jgi:hypothetical protein
MPPQDPTTPNENPVGAPAQPMTGPTPEMIEMTKKVMRDSLAARKPKGFLESIKEWFR